MPSFDPDANKLSKILELLVLIICVIVFGILLFLSVVCIYYPCSIINLRGLIPQKYYYYVLIGILIAIFNLYFKMCLGISTILAGSLFVTYLFCFTVLYTKKLGFGRDQEKYWSLRVPRSNPENLWLSITCFQFLNANFLYIIGTLMAFYHDCAYFRKLYFDCFLEGPRRHF